MVKPLYFWSENFSRDSREARGGGKPPRRNKAAETRRALENIAMRAVQTAVENGVNAERVDGEKFKKYVISAMKRAEVKDAAKK